MTCVRADILAFFLILRESIHCVVIMMTLGVTFPLDVLYHWWRFPSIHSLSLRIFIMNGCENLSCKFPLHFIFLFCSVYVVNCIGLFLNIKAALHYWCKHYLIMMYYSFDILLNLIFLKFRVFPSMFIKYMDLSV